MIIIIEINNHTHSIDFKSLDLFLTDNIFKLEKLTVKFIKNITLIVEHIKISNINFGIKKKNYDEIINKKYFENTLVDAKDLYKENFQSEKIMHIIINNYFVNGKNYPTYQENLDGKYIKTLFQNNFTIISDIAYKVKSGFNENEVKLIPKNYKKNGIFEKFFQLFS